MNQYSKLQSEAVQTSLIERQSINRYYHLSVPKEKGRKCQSILQIYSKINELGSLKSHSTKQEDSMRTQIKLYIHRFNWFKCIVTEAPIYMVGLCGSTYYKFEVFA